MNKTIRNVALRDSVNLITADYNGQDWYTDGYWATKYNVFEGYRQKKSQTVYTNGQNNDGKKPQLKPIIENNRVYKQAQTTEQPPKDNEVMTTVVFNGENTEKIQTIYYRLMQTLGADRFEITTDTRLNPIKVYKENQLIGVVMPLRS